MKLIYFGHSRILYDTEEEKKALRIIHDTFPKYRILNPNTGKHQNNSLNEYNGVPGSEMKYFINLTKLCSMGVFLVYDKNKWSPGSYTEADYMLKCNKPVFLIDINELSIKKINKIENHFSFDEERNKLINLGKNVLAGENG